MTYGKLTIIETHRRPPDRWNKYGLVECYCRCECGRTCTVLLKNLKSGRTRSCGCLRKGIHSIIGDTERKEIIDLRSQCLSYNEIAKRYGVSKGCIYAICNDSKE